MPLKRGDLRDPLDGTLAVLLAVLLVRRDLPEEFVHDPWRHTLGTLTRNNLAAAVEDTQDFEQAAYRLHDRWNRRFSGEPRVIDHVFPVHEWKQPLLDLASLRRWSSNARSLQEMRAFVVGHYVTARIPGTLHGALSRSSMPRGWEYEDRQSMWARYKTPKVRQLMGRELRVPGEHNPDFVLF
jgi:hypothetical protein